MNDTTETGGKDRTVEYMKKIPFLGEWLEPTDKVAVLRFAGIIADTTVMRRAGVNWNKFRDAIPDAFDVKRLRAVAIIINSPGGAPAQCSLITDQIVALSKEKKIPVYAFVEDIAASGGYWLACAADEIYVQETSIVGSIGVISSSFGLDQFIQKHNVQRRVYTSGKEKSFLDPFKPEKEDDLQRLKAIQADMHESFKAWVKSRRAGKLAGDDNELMEGAFWTGRDAVDKGIADHVGHVITVMKEKFGDEIKFVDCTPEKKSFLSSLLPLGADSKLDLGQIVEVAEERSAWSRFGL